jgi:predicted aspartyl protease
MARACVLIAIACAASYRGRAQVEVGDEPDLAIREFRLDELEASLLAMPEGSRYRNYFAGILAAANGETDDAIRLLSDALPILRTARPDRAAIALETLASVYSRTFRYADAARAIDDLLAHFESYVPAVEREDLRDGASLAAIVRDVPPQTIARRGHAHLATQRNRLHSVSVELVVNGVKGRWLVDTGTSLSIVSNSLAKRLGLTVLPGETRMRTATGSRSTVRLAVLPTLQLGEATLTNVLVAVLDDADLYVGRPGRRYQIQAVLGEPVFEAFETVTFRRDGWLDMSHEPGPREGGAPMYFGSDALLIACPVDGRVVPLVFDSGAASTVLSSRYYERFHRDGDGWKSRSIKMYGAGGATKETVYVQAALGLGLDDSTITLKNVPILASDAVLHHAEAYGNVGQDVITAFDRITLDFGHMRVAARRAH